MHGLCTRKQFVFTGVIFISLFAITRDLIEFKYELPVRSVGNLVNENSPRATKGSTS